MKFKNKDKIFCYWHSDPMAYHNFPIIGEIYTVKNNSYSISSGVGWITVEELNSCYLEKDFMKVNKLNKFFKFIFNLKGDNNV